MNSANARGGLLVLGVARRASELQLGRLVRGARQVREQAVLAHCAGALAEVNAGDFALGLLRCLGRSLRLFGVSKAAVFVLAAGAVATGDAVEVLALERGLVGVVALVRVA